MGGNGGNGGGRSPLDLRVLVVEDDPVDAELMLDALADDGIVVESRVVQDEQAFLDALRDFAPALVLSDVALPGFSGLRALSQRLENAEPSGRVESRTEEIDHVAAPAELRRSLDHQDVPPGALQPPRCRQARNTGTHDHRSHRHHPRSIQPPELDICPS